MVRIALDAGHGYNTSGKRTPDDEREWSFNNEVIIAAIDRLNTYKDVEILRLDDPTGKTDVSLKSRTDKANAWKADVLVSDHHNASKGVWHSGGGVETYVYPTASQTSKDVAKAIHKRVVEAMGLRDRGVKTADFHITREAKMASVLVEGGFMDSTTDIKAMRDKSKLKAQGIAIAEGIAEVFKLKPKTEVAGVANEVIILTPGQQKAKDSLVKHGLMAKDYEIKDPTILTLVTMLAPLVNKLEAKGSI